jgi:hypothetical protein
MERGGDEIITESILLCMYEYCYYYKNLKMATNE